MIPDRTRQSRSNAAILLVVVIIGLAVVAGFIAVRAVALVQQGAPAGTPANQPPAASTDAHPPAPNVEIVMYQGDATVGSSKVRLSQFWGKGKPVVVNYFAGLCPPCRKELPDFQRLYTGSAKGKFILIGVDVGPFVGLGSREDGKALLREMKITFPAGTILSANEFGKNGIFGMPTTLFITADGRFFRQYTGLLTHDQMTAFLGELLKASGTP